MNYYEYTYKFLGKEKPILLPNNFSFSDESLTNKKSSAPHSEDATPSGPVSLKDFDYLKVIGRGGFSKVYLVRNKANGEYFAMKSIKVPTNKHGQDKATFQKQVMYEKDILMQMKHPFIVKLRYAFYEKSHFFLVMELVLGGEVFKYVKSCEQNMRESM